MVSYQRAHGGLAAQHHACWPPCTSRAAQRTRRQQTHAQRSHRLDKREIQAQRCQRTHPHQQAAPSTWGTAQPPQPASPRHSVQAHRLRIAGLNKIHASRKKRGQTQIQHGCSECATHLFPHHHPCSKVRPPQHASRQLRVQNACRSKKCGSNIKSNEILNLHARFNTFYSRSSTCEHGAQDAIAARHAQA